LGHDYRPIQMGSVYADPDIWQMQTAIFPDYPNFLDVDGNPTNLIDDVERILDAAEVHLQLRPITREMHESIAQFRGYANATIQYSHNLRDALRESGYAWQYAEVDFVLLEQLGMERQDQGARPKVQANGLGKDELVQILQAFQASNREERAELIKILREPQVDGNTMAASPIDEETEATVHTCECGKEFPALQGLKLHQTRYCELTKGDNETA